MLSAILYLGNVTYQKKSAGRDEGLEVGPPEVLDILSQLLKVGRASVPIQAPSLGEKGAQRCRAEGNWGGENNPRYLQGIGSAIDRGWPEPQIRGNPCRQHARE